MQMNKIILLILLCLGATGCSFLPKISFEKSLNPPQQTSKSNVKQSCKGEFKTDENGIIVSCSKGYTNQTSNSEIKERNYTILERVFNFLRKLTWWSLIIVILLCALPFGIGGAILQNMFDNGKKVSSKALELTVKAVNKAKNNGGEYLKELSEAYSSDVEVQKLINDIRAKIKTKQG